LLRGFALTLLCCLLQSLLLCGFALRTTGLVLRACAGTLFGCGGILLTLGRCRFLSVCFGLLNLNGGFLGVRFRLRSFSSWRFRLSGGLFSSSRGFFCLGSRLLGLRCFTACHLGRIPILLSRLLLLVIALAFASQRKTTCSKTSARTTKSQTSDGQTSAFLALRFLALLLGSVLLITTTQCESPDGETSTLLTLRLLSCLLSCVLFSSAAADLDLPLNVFDAVCASTKCFLDIV
jgi:hypothetical protein